MSGTSTTTSDTEIVRNLHQPEGWRRDGIDFFVAPPPRCPDIVSSSLRELDAVALATNVTVFMKRGTERVAVYSTFQSRPRAEETLRTQRSHLR